MKVRGQEPPRALKLETSKALVFCNYSCECYLFFCLCFSSIFGLWDLGECLSTMMRSFISPSGEEDPATKITWTLLPSQSGLCELASNLLSIC